jgi:hypothetical protein
MFRNNFNETQSNTLNTLNYIKQTLTEQRDNYINLLNQNRQMIETIDRYIDNYEINSTELTPQQSIRTSSFPTNSRVLTNDEILRYTTANLYGEIQEPLNTTCHLSGIRFRDDDWVCRLPCGHLFDGPSVCYHLTRLNSLCPICSHDVTSETQPQRRNTRTTLPLPLRRRRTRNNLFSNTTTTSSFNDLFSNEFTTLFSAILSATDVSTTSNLLTETEINNATEQIRYGNIENPISERCPISYVEFDQETNVSRIKHCQHIFEPNSLTLWLTRHNTCPVCRYNLKMYGRENEETETNNQVTTNDELPTHSRDSSGNTMYNRNRTYATYYYFTG